MKKVIFSIQPTHFIIPIKFWLKKLLKQKFEQKLIQIIILLYMNKIQNFQLKIILY